MRTVSARRRRHLHIGRVRTGFFFSEGKCAELLAGHKFRQPFLFLFVRAKQQKRANPNRMMRVYEN